MDISVFLPVVNECDNLRVLLPRIHDSLKRARLSYESVVIDGGSIDRTREAAAALGARVVAECRRGFGAAMEIGYAEAAGDYILTLDADLSDDPDFIDKPWKARLHLMDMARDRACIRLPDVRRAHLDEPNIHPISEETHS